MPEEVNENVEKVISNFIAALSEKFKEAKKSNGVTEKFLMNDVWPCMKDFQAKCPRNNIGSDLPQFLINISINKAKNDINTIIEIIKYGISKLGNEQPKMKEIMESILEEFKKPKAEPKKEETKTTEKNGEQNKKTYNWEKGKENIWDAGFQHELEKFSMVDFSKISTVPNKILQCFWSRLTYLYVPKIDSNLYDYDEKDFTPFGKENKEIALDIKKVNDNNVKNSKFGDISDATIKNESDIGDVLNFLRKTIKKHSNSKFELIRDLVKICKNALKAYSTAKAKEEKEKQKEGKQNAKKEKLSKTVFNNVKNYLKKACDSINMKAGRADTDMFQKAFEELKELAEMEMSEKSTSEKKGLSGWYNDFANVDSKDIGLILHSFIKIDGYVKGTGFLGLGKSRLKDIEKIVNKNEAKLKSFYNFLSE